MEELETVVGGVESLPARERGLKKLQNLDGGIQGLSLPARERGLKIRDQVLSGQRLQRRSPRGSVD